MRQQQVEPHASILIESMRNIGYSLHTALADIIDNSIAAGASEIDIFVDSTGASPKLCVVDNGHGMSELELLEAMRLGTKNPMTERSSHDLGRFGLGLKTASFSQCRRLTVVSRKERDVSCACWDLDKVAETNKWYVDFPDNISGVPWFSQLPDTGTLVLWENLDRIVELKNKAAESRTELIRQIDESLEHLELVYHRYLAGEKGLKKIQITLNGRKLTPFDPYHINHPATQASPEETIRLSDKDILIKAFTLPHHKKVTAQEWERLAGRDGYLKNQGFYIYRKKRLIIHGTWFGLAKQAELTKLSRVRIDIPNELDFDWRIDVKKSSAQLPLVVRERLRRIIETIGSTSKRVYTSKSRLISNDSRLPVWKRYQDKNEITYSLNSEHPVFSRFIKKLPETLKKDFEQIMELTSATIPVDSLFSDLSATPDRLSSSMSTASLYDTVDTTLSSLLLSGLEEKQILDMLRMTEPFKSSWDDVEKIIEKIKRDEVQ